MILHSNQAWLCLAHFTARKWSYHLCVILGQLSLSSRLSIFSSGKPSWKEEGQELGFLSFFEFCIKPTPSSNNEKTWIIRLSLECRRASQPVLSCSSVHRQGLRNCFPSEKYVHFYLPWMALTNESALSFLMPSVPFLPVASSHNPANKTCRYFGFKKMPWKPRGQSESTSVLLQVTRCKNDCKERFFLFPWELLGPWSAFGWTPRNSGANECRWQMPALKWRCVISSAWSLLMASFEHPGT